MRKQAKSGQWSVARSGLAGQWQKVEAAGRSLLGGKAVSVEVSVGVVQSRLTGHDAEVGYRSFLRFSHSPFPRFWFLWLRRF
jgi:hypothetical protein